MKIISFKMDSGQKGNIECTDGADPDFVWQDYLDDTQSLAAPPTAFTHVEYSLESGFKVGMKLEIPNPDDKSTYWPASVIMTCGDLLTLRYIGCGEDRFADFWFNIKSGEFHPIGWCSSNNKILKPPKCVADKHSDSISFLDNELKSADSIPSFLSDNLDAGLIPIDQIKCGMKLEVVEMLNANSVWIATIKQNVGGRLLLRYDGCESDSNAAVWIFYLSDRLYSIGWAQKNNLQYSPPIEYKMLHSSEEWDEILKASIKESDDLPFPTHILEPKIPLEMHAFEENMKLEVVNPSNFSELCPATITKVINDYYFMVTVDTFSSDEKEEVKCNVSCHSNCPYIFPIRWAAENGLQLKVPKGYVCDSEFSWDEYLKFCNGSAAPPELFPMCFMNMGFEEGMKLEAADTFHQSTIHATTIKKVVEPLLWLQFESDTAKQKCVISSVNSFDIYPVGWCDSNSFPLHTPPLYKPKMKLSPVPEVKPLPEKSSHEVSILSPTAQSCKSWCPKIYFNHRCFTGPLLSKSRLAELPQAIGPGPLHLVIQEVIYRVVNIAYKSSRVLQILQIYGKPSKGMQSLIIKAKYKGKTNRATIEVIRNSEQVEEFCKNICIKLECCPHLFGPKHVGETCPSNCHTQTKTKFGYNFMKKQKKVGRPPLASNTASSDNGNGEVVKRGPGRRKKRKHWTQLARIEEHEPPAKIPRSQDSSETDENSKGDSVEKPTRPPPAKLPLINKKKLKHTPSSSIVTRGAKLPNFGLWHHVSPFHSRRGRPRTRPIRPFPPRKVGRPLGSVKKTIPVVPVKSKRNSSPEPVEEEKQEITKSITKPTLLESNPLEWSVEDVVKYLQKTDYAPLAPLLKEQEIDGQALLMLNLFNVQQYLHLKEEPAKKFCYLIKNLKIEFFTHYVT